MTEAPRMSDSVAASASVIGMVECARVGVVEVEDGKLAGSVPVGDDPDAPASRGHQVVPDSDARQVGLLDAHAHSATLPGPLALRHGYLVTSL